MLTWIVTDWKLKVLALGLAAVLLFAVAYSQYPIQTVSVDAKINYNNSPPVGLVVNGPPATTKATISGLGSDIRSAIITVDVDLSKLKEGTAVVVNPSPHAPPQGVTINSVTPFTLKVEELTTVNLDIQVRANYANGWQQTKAQAECGVGTQACQVTVSGPISIMRDLSAYVVVDETIQAPERRVPGSVVKFSRSGQDFDLTKVVAIPAISWEPITVTAHVQATQGTETIQVAVVNALPSAPPPNGYHVVAVVVSPLLVLLTGSPQALQGITSITLSPVSLAGLTSDHTFTLKIVPPDPSLQVSVKTATVTYRIARYQTVSPTP